LTDGDAAAVREFRDFLTARAREEGEDCATRDDTGSPRCGEEDAGRTAGREHTKPIVGGQLVPTDGPATPAPPSSRPRRRQVVVRPDGTEAVQTKQARADLLRYPNHWDWPTVLVRRTHDVPIALELAKRLWRERGLDGEPWRHRIGSWTTTTSRHVPQRGAVDEQGRVVVWCDDPGGVHAAGPGIEFRHRAAAPAPGARQCTGTPCPAPPPAEAPR
jgi:hypothetical protein